MSFRNFLFLYHPEPQQKSNWSELDENLWIEIAKRINSYQDFFNFGSACKRWRQLANKENIKYKSRNQIPWLFFPLRGQNSPHISYLTTGRTKTSPLPQLNKKNCRCFASQGWFFVQRSQQISFLNPLSCQEILMPTSIKLLKSEILMPPFNVNATHRIHTVFRVALSNSPRLWNPSDLVVMVICDSTIQSQGYVSDSDVRRLAFYKPNDQEWTEISIVSTPVAILYHNNRFYCLDSEDRLLVWDSFRLEPITALQIQRGPIKFDSQVYLAESSGSLMLVSKRRRGRKAEFQVLRLDKDNGERVEMNNLGNHGVCVEVNNLGNQAVFFDANNGPLFVNLPVEDAGYFGNHIYYIDNRSEYNDEDGMRYVGLYGLETRYSVRYAEFWDYDDFRSTSWIQLLPFSYGIEYH